MNEYILVAVIAVVVLFGGAQVPKIARSIGSAKSEFHKGQREGEESAPATPPAAPQDATTPPAERRE